jgi:threonine aldolase
MTGATRRIELRSDTFTLPNPEMLAAVQNAALGDDVYGEDPTVRRLEELTSELVGKEAACLMPSGTMANLAALLAHCSRGGMVLAGDQSDIYVYEAGGGSVLGGMVLAPVRTERDGSLALDALEGAMPQDRADPQFSIPELVCVENTHNRSGGTPLPPERLREVVDFARMWQLRVHVDGARLFNAAVALDVPAADLVRDADSVQLCLSKGLSAPVGSMLAGGAPFIAGARRWRKMLGGGMRQAGIVAAAGIVALESMIDRLHEDHATARRLAEGLDEIPGIEVRPQEHRTNIVMFRVTRDGLTHAEFLARAQKRGVMVAELGRNQIRAVTHRHVTRADVDDALEVIADVIARGPLSTAQPSGQAGPQPTGVD